MIDTTHTTDAAPQRIETLQQPPSLDRLNHVIDRIDTIRDQIESLHFQSKLLQAERNRLFKALQGVSPVEVHPF